MRDPAATEVPPERATLPALPPRPAHVRGEVELHPQIGMQLQALLAAHRQVDADEIDEVPPPQPAEVEHDPASLSEEPTEDQPLPDPDESLPPLERVDWRLRQLVQAVRGREQDKAELVRLRALELELQIQAAKDQHKLTETRIKGRETCIQVAHRYLLDNPKTSAAAAAGIGGTGVGAFALAVVVVIFQAWASGQLPDLPSLP